MQVTKMIRRYIRDLLTYLRDVEHPEQYHLGISSASTLIRRKASFGTEVIENAEELAVLLVGLQDKYNMAEFHEHRLKSLVALLVAYPLTMGQSLVRTLFNADISQVQRSSILVALGLSARELAGFGEEDAEAMGIPPSSDARFPSRRLPMNLEAIYGTVDTPIATIAKKL